MRSRSRPSGFKAWLEAGHHGSMDWMAETGRAPRRPADPLAGGAQRHPARAQLRPAGGSSGRAARERTAATISVYARNRDYHDVIKGKLKEAAGFLASRASVGREGLRRYGAGDGKAAGGGRGTRLAGQAHGRGLARIRQLAVPRRDLHHGGAAGGRAGARPLRLLPPLPRHLPDERFPGALPARCAALHLVSHHRA